MASPRRIGAPDAKNRSVLIDAAQELMLAEGYAAVTSRRVASKAGLKPQLVHYYFRTMDDLFLAIFRRLGDAGLERQRRALASDQPLRALWAFDTEPAGTALTMEFVALSNHRKAIRSVIAEYSEQFRTAELAALKKILDRYQVDPREFPPAVVAVFMTSLSRVLTMETALGMSGGHAETTEFVQRWLERLEPSADASSSSSSPAEVS